MAERLLVATGRRPDLAGLNVASIGLDESAPALPVDDHLRVEGVDGRLGRRRRHRQGGRSPTCRCTRPTSWSTTSSADQVVPADYRAVPRVTFTDPEIGSVGLNERDARDQGIEVRVGTAPIPESARGWIHKAGQRGLHQAGRGRRAGGCWSGPPRSGPWGGEVLGLLTLAVHAEVPTTRLRHMIYAYPTFHRAIETAVKDLLDE